jgi:hypothetical protein
MGQAKWDRKMMACRSEMPGQTARTGLPVHDCQNMIASIRLHPGQDFSVGLPRQDFQDMTSGIEVPEQILL